MAEIEVLSTCSVTMANPSNGISKVDLTPWDLQLLLLDPIQKGIFFYEPESPTRRQEFEETFIHHLKTSLSLTLDFFPPLAGRLAATSKNDDASYYHVDCNNAGASFTHAIARGVHVHDVLDSLHTPIIVRSFFPLNGIPNCEGVSNPLLGVQVTELVDGFFIACTINHCLMDGTSFWHFFNSWAEISRGAVKVSKSPVFERSFNGFLPLNIPIPIPHSELKPSDNKFKPGPLLERVFTFGKENLSKLKAKANSEAGTSKISSLQALMAHVWRAVMRSRGLDPAEEVGCLIIVGARTRVPLPDTYFGNAIHFASVRIENEKLERNGLGWVALEVNKIVSMQTKEEVKRMFEDLGENFKLFKKDGVLLKNRVAISSSPRHNVYGVDFGWGKPVAVRSGKGQKYDGKLTVYPAAEEGGIDVEACLSPESLAVIGDDAEFMDAVTFLKDNIIMQIFCFSI